MIPTWTKCILLKPEKSVRTFDGRKITKGDKEKLLEYIKTIENPYGIPVEFLILDSEKYNLSSPIIKGEDTYIAAKVAKVDHCEEAYGYSFEKMALYAWSIGIGTNGLEEHWTDRFLKKRQTHRTANT